MTVMAERWDAGRAVAGGAPGVDTAAYLTSLRAEAGTIVGTIDWVVRTVSGHDLIATIIEPLAGDYPTIASMQQGWRQVEAALGSVGDNHVGLAGQLPAAWTGESHLAAGAALGELAEVAAHQAEAAGLIAEQLGHVMEVSLAAAETVCACLRLIDDVVARVLIKLAAGPVGTLLAGVTAPAEAARIVAMIRRARDAIDRVVEVVRVCLEVVSTIRAVLDAAAVVTGAVAVAGHARAGAMADETAEEGFG